MIPRATQVESREDEKGLIRKSEDSELKIVTPRTRDPTSKNDLVSKCHELVVLFLALSLSLSLSIIVVLVEKTERYEYPPTFVSLRRALPCLGSQKACPTQRRSMWLCRQTWCVACRPTPGPFG